MIDHDKNVGQMLDYLDQLGPPAQPVPDPDSVDLAAAAHELRAAFCYLAQGIRQNGIGSGPIAARLVADGWQVHHHAPLPGYFLHLQTDARNRLFTPQRIDAVHPIQVEPWARSSRSAGKEKGTQPPPGDHHL